MRRTSRRAGLLACATAIAAGLSTVGGPAPEALAEPGVGGQGAVATWTGELDAGESAGVVVEAGTARMEPGATHLLPSDDDGRLVPTGLLTLPVHRLEGSTDRVEADIDAVLPAGSTALVDIRGRRIDGGWTEWLPGADGSVELPEPTTEVQTRLVLTHPAGADSTATTGPAVRGVQMTARPAAPGAEARAQGPAVAYRVFATREGLVGGTTANGYVIPERARFVALPSRRALAPRGTDDYSVRVCAGNGRCTTAPVWDVGPWNTRDDYWNPSDVRQEWRDLPRGLPQAQAAFEGRYNGGNDQFARRVANPAGIDLADGVFWDDLGLRDNAWVTVEYLWTGDPAPSPLLSLDVGLGLGGGGSESGGGTENAGTPPAPAAPAAPAAPVRPAVVPSPTMDRQSRLAPSTGT